MKNPKNLPLAKKLAFALIPVLLLLLLLEVGTRCVYYQWKAPQPIALKYLANSLKNTLAKARAQNVAAKIPKISPDALFTPMGEAILREFKQEYETEFAKLVEEVNAADARLIFMYVPFGDYSQPVARIAECRAFFGDLAQKYGVDYLDLMEEFRGHPYETITLRPQNAHLSRFGNKVVVDALSTLLARHDAHRSSVVSDETRAVLGDLRPGVSSVWDMHPKMPYRVTSNRQGLRMTYDLAFPKTKQRILVLGDSYTFGPYLDDHDTYPALLDARYPEKEVINAGICGYSIPQVAALFNERAKYSRPDIVILQVVDNDLLGFFFYEKNIYARFGEVHHPSETEKAFLKAWEENKGK